MVEPELVWWPVARSGIVQVCFGRSWWADLGRLESLQLWNLPDVSASITDHPSSTPRTLPGGAILFLLLRSTFAGLQVQSCAPTCGEHGLCRWGPFSEQRTSIRPEAEQRGRPRSQTLHSMGRPYMHTLGWFWGSM